MGKSAKVLLLGFILSTLIATLPGQAQAASVQDLFRVQSFVDTYTANSDPTLARSRHELMAVRFFTDTAAGDTLIDFKLHLYKTPKSDFTDTVYAYLDNGNGTFDAGDSFVAFLTGSSTNGETKQVAATLARILPQGGETFIILADLNSSLATTDTLQIRFLRQGQFNVSTIGRIEDALIQQVPKNATGDTFGITFTARIDSTVVRSSFLGNFNIHPDSRVGGNPFTVLSGVVQGETRGFTTDRLRSVGIGFGGTARDSVVSAWILLGGRPTDTISLARTASETWSATVDSALTVNRAETFLVRITMWETVAIPSTVWAYVPKDSVTTLIRPSGPAANTDSSGVFTLQRPQLGLTISNLRSDSQVHPDSRVRGIDSVTVLTGFFTFADSVTYDTITQFSVGISGSAWDTITTAEVRIDNGNWIPLIRQGVSETWVTAVFATTITATDSAFTVRAIVPETTAVPSTLYAYLGPIADTAVFSLSAPVAASDSSTLFTILRPQLGLTISNLLADSIVHPDSRARSLDSVTILTGFYTLGSGVTYDTITQFSVGISGSAWDTITTAEVRIDSGNWIPLVRQGVSETWVTTACTTTITATDSAFTVRAIVPETTAVPSTLYAYLGRIADTAVFSLSTPVAASDSSTLFTILRPQLGATISNLLADSIVHPDSRARSLDSVTILSGFYTLGSGVSYDTITQFSVGISGSAWDTITTAEVRIDNGNWIPLVRQGVSETWVTATFATTITATDSAFTVRAIVPETTAVPSTLYAYLGRIADTAVFSLSTPITPSDSSTLFTILRPQLGLTILNLFSDSIVHPDSRVRGVDSITVLRGFYSFASGVTYDTISQFSVGFGGTARDTIASPEVKIGSGSWIPLSRQGVSDTWVTAAFLTTITAADSAFIVRARIPETTAVPSTLNAFLGPQACTPVFSLSAPITASDSSTLFTIRRPQFGVSIRNLFSDSIVHPDSRVRGIDSTTVLSGTFLFVNMDSVTYDTITQFSVGFGGTARDTIASPEVKIGSGSWIPLSRQGVSDTWVTAAFATTITAADSAFVVRARIPETTAVPSTLNAYLGPISCTPVFSLSTPSAASDSSTLFTIRRPQFGVSILNLFSDSIVHPDSRVRGIDSTTVLRGTFLFVNMDSVTYDTITQFSVGFGGTARDTIASPEVKIGSGNWIPLSRQGVSDTWVTAAFATTITAADSAFVVRARIPETTAVPSTLNAYLGPISCTPAFSLATPTGASDSSTLFTIRRPQFGVTISNLNTDSTVHPDSRVRGIDSMTVLSGSFSFANMDSVTYDTITQFSVGFGGTARDTIASPEVKVGSGNWIPLTRQGVSDTWVTAAFATTITAADSAFVVRARIPETTAVISTLNAYLGPISCTPVFSLSTPSGASDSSALFSIKKPTINVSVFFDTNRNIHPDSRVTPNQFRVLSGKLIVDTTQPRMTYDTVLQLSVSFGGSASDSVTNPRVAIANGGWVVLNRLGTTDTWVAQVDTTIHDNDSFQVWAGVAETVTIGTVFNAYIGANMCTTSFSFSGPAIATDSSGVTTCTKPILRTNPQFIATVGNDTINPIVAFATPVRVHLGIFGLDTSLIPFDRDTVTAIEVRFGGSASDSVYNAQIAFDTMGPWLSMVKVGADTWILVGLDSSITSNETFAIRINLADSTTIGTNLSSFVTIYGCTTMLSTQGPGQGADSSGLFQISADAVQLGMFTLGDTSIPEFQQLASNPVLVCSGVIYTNIGPVAMPTYDTLTSFGVQFDTQNPRVYGDTIEAVSLYLWATGARPADTIALTVDSVGSADSRLWRLPVGADTNIAETQPFQIFVRLRTVRDMNNRDTLYVRVAKDSVNTTFTSGLAGDTHSSRVVTFIFPDTIQLINNATLTDTNVNPDTLTGENPFIIFGGLIQGARAVPVAGAGFSQQYLPAATDSLTYFGIGLASFATSDVTVADSITSATLYLGVAGESIALTAGAVYTDAFGARIKPFFTSGVLNKKLDTTTNSCTFLVRATVAETVALSVNSRVRAFMHSDSIQTYFMADSRPVAQQIVLGTRIVTFTKAAFSITATTLADTIVSPFRVQNDSTLILEGRIASSQAPSDSLTSFQVKVFSNAVIQDSITLKVEFLAGPGVASETTLVVDTPGLNPVFKMSAAMTVDSGQIFRIRVVPLATGTNLLGDTLSLRIETATAAFSVGAATVVTSGRVVSFNYVDTLVISDSALGAITIHPDSRQLQNPFVAYVGRFDGQMSPMGVTDTLQRIGFRFVGSAVAGGDSVAAAWVLLKNGASNDTISLIRAGSDNWSVTLDSAIAIDGFGQASISCTLYVRVFETVALGATFQATIPSDSVSTLLQADTSLFTASRIVTFNKPRVALTPDVLVNVTVHPDSRIVGQPVLVASGRILVDTVLTLPLAADTITSFGVSLVFNGMGVTEVESVAVVINGETFQMARVGTLDSWSATPNKPFADSTGYQIYLNVRETTVQGATVTAFIMPDSITAELRLSGPSSVISSGRVVTFAKPGTQADLSTIASRTIHPVFTQLQNPTTILSGSISGDSAAPMGDTLQVFQINVRGTSKDSVTGCTLVIGPGAQIVMLTKTGISVGGDTWEVAPTFTFQMPDSTADTFSVIVRVDEFVNQNGTITAFVPARGLKTLFTDSGPASDTSSGATLTYVRGTMKILTEPRNIGFTGAIQARDTKEIMWFRAQISDSVEQDTIHRLTINLLGPDSTKYTHVYLVRDFNQNQKFDTNPADSIVGQFTAVAGTNETWTINLSNQPAYTPTDTIGHDTFYSVVGGQETTQYLIVVRLSDTSASSVRARVPIGGADGPFSEPNVVAALYDSYNIIVPDTNPPLPPFDFTLTVNAGNFVINFGPSPSGDTQMTLGQYNIYWDSGLATMPDTIMQVIPHVSGQVTYSVIVSNLTPDAQYRFSLKAQDQAGNQGNATSIISAIFRGAGTPAAPVGATLVEPTPGDVVYSDSRVGANQMQFVAQLTTGQVGACSTVLFYIRPITGGAWTLIGAATDSSFDATGISYYSLNYDSALLTTQFGLYELRATALSLTGILDTYAYGFSIQTTTDTSLATSVNIPGTSIAFDSWYRERVISTRSADDFMLIRSLSGAFDVVLRMAMGSLSHDTDRLFVRTQHGLQSDSVLNAVRAAGVLVPEYWVNILLQSGQTTLLGNGATITVNYIDANFDGVDDSTGIDMSKAKIYTVSAGGRLEMLSNVVFDKTRRTLSAHVSHFSPFFVSNDTGTATNGLNQLIVGPNPFRPNDGNAQTGRAWVPGDATTGIMFKNLPNQVRIEIFTILGERVTEINKNDANATISWSVKNDDGKDVASGYYLYVVTDLSSKQRVTGKIAVIR